MTSVALRITLLVTLLKGSSLPFQPHLLLLSPLIHCATATLAFSRFLAFYYLRAFVNSVSYTLNVLPFILCITGSLSHLSGLSFSPPQRGEPPNENQTLSFSPWYLIC